MSNSELEKITPADPALSPHPTAPVLGMGNSQEAKQAQQKNTKILTGIFALLLILVIGVIFVLPRYISPTNPEVTTIEIKPPVATPTGVTPYQEAQQLEQREDAQNILASLLELQDALEEKRVEAWALEQFNAAIEQARQGDEVYSQQSFVEAQAFYQAGLNILQSIESSMPDVFDQFMASGEQAILTDEPSTAEQAFNLAILINPDSPAAVTGYNRAQTLAKVLDLLSQGRTNHENKALETAREFYQQALIIDAIHVGTNAALIRVDTDIIERNFLNAMSQGYAAIQNDTPELAKTAFTQALNIRPDSAQAQQALEQVADQITSTTINQHLSRAQGFERDESWQQALDEYNLALLIGPNVVTVLDGKSRSNSRNNLDVFLQNTLHTPLRLADTAVYQQALRVLQDARKINNPGPKLLAQLQELGNFLNRVTQATPVTFVSDGLTQVTIYQTSTLGLFTTQTLALTPGTYVAVGARDGYRDVREEFIVPLDGQIPTITVQCDEKIR